MVANAIAALVANRIAKPIGPDPDPDPDPVQDPEVQRRSYFGDLASPLWVPYADN